MFVSGTVGAYADGRAVDPSPYLQALKALQRIEAALKESGAELKHVVRTRMYVTDISNWEDVGRAHGEYFGAIRPANTIMQVTRFIDPDWLIEFEADAVVE